MEERIKRRKICIYPKEGKKNGEGKGKNIGRRKVCLFGEEKETDESIGEGKLFTVEAKEKEDKFGEGK